MTVGGCFSGIAASSSSFKYGYFDRTVNWIELLLPDGKITRASRQRNSELLNGMVGTMGTIGVVTLLQVKLVPAARFVELTYVPVTSMSGAVHTMHSCVHDSENDFVEGLIFGEKAHTFGVVAIGRFSAFKTDRLYRFTRAGDPWFYHHVLEAGARATVCVPMMDYLFRYDRGSFCTGKLCFGRIPFNRCTRWLTDYAMRSVQMAKLVQSLDWSEHLFLQDLAVPMDSATEMLQHLRRVRLYPLFLCPVRNWPQGNCSKLHNHLHPASPHDGVPLPSTELTSNLTVMRPFPDPSTQLSLIIGVRASTPTTLHDYALFKQHNRKLEHLVKSLGDTKFLHGRHLYSEEEFWEIYPRLEYETLRIKYNAQYLPSVFEKTRTKGKGGNKGKMKPKVGGFWRNVLGWSSVVGMEGRTAESRGGKLRVHHDGAEKMD